MQKYNTRRWLGSTLILTSLFALGLPSYAQEPRETQEGFGLPALLAFGPVLIPLKDQGTSPEYPDDEDEVIYEEPFRRVRALKGTVHPKEPLPAESTWYILRGTALKKRPKRLIKVELYSGRGANKRLLVVITVKYFQDKNGAWQPWYQLDSDYIANWGRMQNPMSKLNEQMNSMFNIASRSPNGEGYFPYLKLRSTLGPVAIDSWIVGFGYY